MLDNKRERTLLYIEAYQSSIDVWALVLNIQQGLKQLATSPVAVGKISYRTIRPVYSSHSDSRPCREREEEK